MRLTAETTQLTCELVLFLLQHSFKHFCVDLLQSTAAAPLRGAKGTLKWVRVKISSTIIHGTPPISTIPPPCEKSALHCSEGRQNGGKKRYGARGTVEDGISG